MTGQKPLLEMRLDGRHPSFLWVKTDLPASREWHLQGDQPEIGIEPHDYPELLDLRTAMGSTVMVDGCNAVRVAAVGKAFLNANAARVIVTLDTGGPWPEVVSISDSEGVMTWPK
jgi:hypothetical protein